ncbi:ABC transporter permease [Nonomuraea sp. NPDC003214]
MTGLGALIRLVLRRDRLLLPVWLAVAALVPYSVAAGASALYTTAEALHRYAAEAMGNAAQVAMRGAVYAPTAGGVVAWGAGMSSALIAALASVLVVVRHSRAEEEAGRRELVGSAAVGRHAGLAAVLCVVAGANLVSGALIAAGLVAAGLPVAGSVLLGLSTAGAGVAAGAVAAVAAQLTAGAGAARGLAFAALAALFLLRAAGDVQTYGTSGTAGDPAGGMAGGPAGDPAGGPAGGMAEGMAGGFGVAWLSPFGWARLSLAFAGDRWWVLGLFAGFAAVAAGLAFALAAQRDLAAGVLRPRPGPDEAGAALRGPFGLAWRTHRGAMLAWTAASAVVGALLGGAGAGTRGQLGDVFSGADALFTFSLLVLSQAVSGYAVTAALRPRAEERDGAAELLLSTPASRVRWAAAHVAFAVAGPVLMLGAAGLTMGLTYGISLGDVGGQVPAMAGAALLWLPAVWVVAGLAVALLGLAPRAVAVAWAALGAFLLVELAFEFGRVGEGVLGLSPFSHVPKALLGVPVSPASPLGLTAVAAALAAAGLAGMRRRDLG